MVLLCAAFGSCDFIPECPFNGVSFGLLTSSLDVRDVPVETAVVPGFRAVAKARVEGSSFDVSAVEARFPNNVFDVVVLVGAAVRVAWAVACPLAVAPFPAEVIADPVAPAAGLLLPALLLPLVVVVTISVGGPVVVAPALLADCKRCVFTAASIRVVSFRTAANAARRSAAVPEALPARAKHSVRSHWTRSVGSDMQSAVTVRVASAFAAATKSFHGCSTRVATLAAGSDAQSRRRRWTMRVKALLLLWLPSDDGSCGEAILGLYSAKSKMQFLLARLC